VIQPEAFAPVVNTDRFQEAQERLYWLIPNKWRKGVRAVQKAERNLQLEIFTLLVKKGVEVDDADLLLKKLPMALGARFDIDGVTQWCFVVKEYMKNYDYILGVSVSIDSHDPVDRFFWIPISNFATSNFFIFSESDPGCTAFTIPPNEVEEKILSFIK
jgi:hypothetical protein